MQETNQERDTSEFRSHEEILELIDVIKDLENSFEEFELEEPEKEEEELIEVNPEEITPIPIKTDEEVKQKKQKKHGSKPVIHTSFKVRFDESGELVNLDLRKTKKEPEKKKKISLKRLGKGRKKEKTENTESEEKSKKSKLKSGLGKIGKLKKVIPSRGKKTEEAKSAETKE